MRNIRLALAIAGILLQTYDAFSRVGVFPRTKIAIGPIALTPGQLGVILFLLSQIEILIK